jgi:hypothetical protein
MTLDDIRWRELQGGYRIEYDASIPLRQLEAAKDEIEINKIYDELWNELHNQGDVGLASYLSLPQLVRIGKSKGRFDLNLFGLCCVIEQQRHLGQNPSLPKEYTDYYYNGLRELKQFVISNIAAEKDETILRMALAAFATCSGQVKLGKSIMELDNDVMDEFLKQF